METEKSYKQMVRYGIRKLAKDGGVSVKELRKNMKELGLNYSLEKLMESKIFHEECSKNMEEIEQFYNDGDIASLAAA